MYVMADHTYWRRFGKALRDYRKTAGITQQGLAKQLHMATPTISAYETGRRVLSRENAEQADAIVSAGGSLVALWDEMSRSSDLPEDWRDFTKAERQASEVREYQPVLIPGLLQTKEYAAAVMRNSGVWSEEQIEHLSDLRTKRLGETNARLRFVIDESALRKVVGATVVLREQLDRISALVAERRVKVSVVPLHAPDRPVPNGAFRIMTLNGGTLVAHEEHISGAHVVTGGQAQTLVSVFGALQGEALPTGTSAKLITSIREELKQHE